jgi:hypothetical protein
MTDSLAVRPCPPALDGQQDAGSNIHLRTRNVVVRYATTISARKEPDLTLARLLLIWLSARMVRSPRRARSVGWWPGPAAGSRPCHLRLR